MNPVDFITTAKELLNNSTPSNCRTAIGRAYDAVYNFSCELLSAAGIKIPTGPGGHGDVQKYLNNCGIEELRVTQQKLVNLHGDGIRADYRLNLQDVEKKINAEKAIKKSESLISTLNTCKSDEKLKEIYKGVQKYKEKIASVATK